MQVSGLVGNVAVNNTIFPFKKWSGTIETKQITRNNWFAGGFQQLVSGFTSGQFTVEGPWDVGNTPITSGSKYTFTFYVTGTVGISVPCNVESLAPEDDAEEAPNIRVTLKSNGPFTPAIT